MTTRPEWDTGQLDLLVISSQLSTVGWVLIYVPKLDDEIVLYRKAGPRPTPEDAAAIRAKNLVVYSDIELAELVRLKITPEELVTIHAAKKLFPRSVLVPGGEVPELADSTGQRRPVAGFRR